VRYPYSYIFPKESRKSYILQSFNPVKGKPEKYLEHHKNLIKLRNNNILFPSQNRFRYSTPIRRHQIKIVINIGQEV